MSSTSTLIATGVVFAAGIVAVYFANERTKHFDVLEAVPDDAFLVATADMPKLRRSPLYEAVLGPSGTRALGLGGVEAACGFDPATRVENLVFVIPEGGEQGEFGVAATVLVKPDEIKTCALRSPKKRALAIRS